MTRPLPVVTIGHGLGWAGDVLAPLTAAGLDVHSVRDCDGATGVLAARPASVCLVDLTDGDAPQTVRVLRARFERTVIIGVADPARPGRSGRALVDGCHDVVARPLAGVELTAIMANVREMAMPFDAVSSPSVESIGLADLVGASPEMRRLNELVQRAAETRVSVLIVSERGFDLAAIAREVHVRGRHAAAPFVTIDCAAANPGDLEPTIFGNRSNGHGREADDVELVEAGCGLLAASGGTLFLGNVAEMPTSVQARLARIARDREVLTAGEVQPQPFDARLVAGAGPGIDVDVDDGRFRADLHRRLSALRLFVPPLRDRVEDIPLLVSRLAQSLCEVAGIPPVRFTSGAVTVLGALPWPGNLSELRSVLSQIVSAAGGDVVGVEDVLRHVRLDGGTPRAVVNGSLSAARARFEKEYIEAVLDRYQWRMAEAAKALGMQRPNLYRKARQLGLSRSRSQ